MTTSNPSPSAELERATDSAVEAVVFTPAPGFRHFDAEFHATADLVFHFFRATTNEPQPAGHWTREFPQALERAAKDYFRADAPRLQAAHVNEFGIDSWWLAARGFGRSLRPDLLAYGFLARLDQELDEPAPALSP